jgi:FkbM family methyltransferase
MARPLTFEFSRLTASFSQEDPFSRWLFERQQGRGLYEEFATETFLEHVMPDTCILDVGANIGWYSIWASMKAPAATIHAFEIDPENCRRFRENADLNSCSNIMLWNLAIGENDSTVCYEREGVRSALEYRVRPIGQHSGPLVRCSSLDAWCLENHVRPRLIKIDVEGLEYGVLRGMRAVLSELKPTVFVEYHRQGNDPGNFGFKDICRLMESAGYSVDEVSKDATRTIVPARTTSVASNAILLFR